MRGREVPARGVRAARLQRRGPRPEELQRRGAALEAPAGGRFAGSAPPRSGRRGRRPGPLHRGGGFGAAARARRRALPAQRQSARDGQVRLQAGLDGASERPRPAPPGAGGELRPLRRLQRHPRAGRLLGSRHVDRRRAVPAREPRRLPRAEDPRPHRGQPGGGPGQAGAYRRNIGIRIDFALLSPQAADRLRGCVIDKHVRGWDKPSDHVPVVVDLDD